MTRPQRLAKRHIDFEEVKDSYSKTQIIRESVESNLMDIHIVCDGQFTYSVRVCTECRECQAMNYNAFLRANESIAEDLMKELREEHAENYIKSARVPPSLDELKTEIENRHIRWDNSNCEQRHPPQ